MAVATCFSSSSLLGLQGLASRRSNSISSSCPMACRLSNKPHRAPLSLKAAAPWLILPAGEAAYSLAEDRLFSLKKGKDWAAPAADDALLVGSSHGWLALYDIKTNHVFLWDPISGRQIKLRANRRKLRSDSEGRVILSCSPDEHGQECYAMLFSGSGSSARPAFCVVGPGGGGDWTELVPARAGVVHEAFLFSNYSDFAYCSERKVWSFITKSVFEFDPDGICVWDNFDRNRFHQIDDWEIPDKNMRVDTTWFRKFRGPPHSWKENEDGEFLSKRCIQKLHLVYSHCRLPLVVVRFIKSSTVGFLVLEMEKEGGCIRVVDDLKGMALFVGINHSFAIPSTGGGGVMPNSIYYTPLIYTSRLSYTSFASNPDDVGIFDYQNKSFYPCYINHIAQSPIDMRLPPMWFTPNPA